MTADRPWGVLGTPTPDQIAEWAAGPYGAFARHVRLNGDPLWALERDAPELFAEIEALRAQAEEEGETELFERDLALEVDVLNAGIRRGRITEDQFFPALRRMIDRVRWGEPDADDDF